MLVNSFDTKFGNTAKKYENLDNIFVNLLKKKKIFKRIFTSILVNQKILNEINLRSDITGQVLNSVISQEKPLDQNLYYMGDVFKKDMASPEVKQFREHGIEVINQNKINSFVLITNLLVEYLDIVLKNNYHFIFTDPKMKSNEKFIFNKKNKKNNSINKFVSKFQSINKKVPFSMNMESNFFSKDYHNDIFFYVYSTKSKKILSQGGGYQYIKNNNKLNGFGFSCNIDNMVDSINE